MARKTGAQAPAQAQSSEIGTTPLNLIVEWPHNPRRTRSKDAVEQSAASQKANGQLVPLILFAVEGATTFYAIDGETRRQGAELRVDRGEIDADSAMRSIVLDASTTHEQLLSIAMAANIVRQQMNPIEEMEAFTDLAKAGMKLAAIGEAYNYSAQQVKQRISLGDLVVEARDLVRTAQRHLRWAEAMTLGSPAQQERIVAEIAANPSAYADAQSVKAELTRGNIPVRNALFDPNLLAGALVVDLFTQDGEGSFNDAEAFWRLQRAEIQTRIDALSETHAHVRYFDRERFNDAGWSTGGEPSTSTAIVVSYDDGSVVVREGMVPPAWASEDALDDGAGDFLDGAGFADEHEADDAASASAAPKGPVDPMDNAAKGTGDYLAAQVVAGLKLAAARDHRVAMAFVIAQTLTRHGGLASSMQINGIGLDDAQQTTEVFQHLRAMRHARDGIARAAGVLGLTSPARVVRALLALDDQALNQIFAWTVAESVATPLNAGTVEIYDAVGVEIMQGWVIEEAYLETLRSDQVRALATQVVASGHQPRSNASVPTVRKAIVDAVEADALQGSWVGSSPTWLPPQVARLRDEVADRLVAEAAEAAAAADPQAIAA